MRADVIRVYKTVHTWTGIVAGMALFIAFYAGALTIFKDPIARWLAPPSPGIEAVALADAQALIERTLQARPAAAREFRIYLQPAEHLTARMGWRERAPERQADHPEMQSGKHYTATLTADGDAQVAPASPSDLPEFIDTLHRVVGLPVDNDPNRLVMGVIAALYSVALVSGFIVLLPTLVKDFFALRLGRNLKRMWLDAHNVIGITSAPFHVVMALTAVVFAFHDGFYGAQDFLIHDGRLEEVWRSEGAPPKPGPRNPADMVPPERLLANLREVAPAFQPIAMQYVQVDGPRAGVRIWGRDPGGIARAFIGGFAAMDPYSGGITSTNYLPGHQPTMAVVVSSFFTLHFGSFGGAPVAWAYFFLGLMGAFLFYSGNLLWIESRRAAATRDDPAPVQKRSTVWMAAATVGVCLGCVAGLSATIVAGKWLHGHVSDLNAWHRWIYYAVFLGAIVWAFHRGAAKASVHLLWLAAAASAAIPLTSLAAVLVPSLGLWANGSVPALGVDLVALAGALGFALAARGTSHRVRAGRTDSVWAAPERQAGRAVHRPMRRPGPQADTASARMPPFRRRGQPE